MLNRYKGLPLQPAVLEVELLSRADDEAFQELMRRHHPRGARPRIGNELRYVGSDGSQWLALASFSAPALKCRARDEWIGWHASVRYGRLGLVANNTRLLIIPNGHCPNLGSRFLAACRRRLRRDWPAHFGQPLLLLETFVDTAVHLGTVYQASGWAAVGFTRGYRRMGNGYSTEPVETVKQVYVQSLQRNARWILCAPVLAPRYCRGGVEMEQVKLKPEHYHSLLSYFESIADVRRAQGRRHQLASVLALAAAAILSGAKGYKGIWLWCDELSQANRRHFRCRLVGSRRLIPSLSTIRSVLMNLSPDELQAHLDAFRKAHFSVSKEPLAADGKTLCGSKDGARRQVSVMNAVGHQSGVVYAKKKLAS